MNAQQDSYFAEKITSDQYCLWNKTTDTLLGAFGKIAGVGLPWVFYALCPGLGHIKGCVRLRTEACRISHINTFI